jgi:hypothetical protein
MISESKSRRDTIRKRLRKKRDKFREKLKERKELQSKELQKEREVIIPKNEAKLKKRNKTNQKNSYLRGVLEELQANYMN